MARNGNTLWGLIDRLRDSNARAGMLGWPVVLTPVVLLLWIVSAELLGPRRSVDVLGIALLLIVIGFPVYVRRQLAAQEPFQGATLLPVGASADIESALSGAMLATGNGVRPDVYILPNATVNAGIWRARPGVLAIGITTGMSQVLSRDELEAVLAHLLARLRMPRDTITFRRDDLQRAADAEAVRLLGNPMALHSALQKSLKYDHHVLGFPTMQVSFFMPVDSVPRQSERRLEELTAACHVASSA